MHWRSKHNLNILTTLVLIYHAMRYGHEAELNNIDCKAVQNSSISSSVLKYDNDARSNCFSPKPVRDESRGVEVAGTTLR